MGGDWKRPGQLNVRAKANKKHPLPALRNAIVRRVQKPPHNSIMKPGISALGSNAFKTPEMINPVLIIPAADSRIGKLKHDVVEIFFKRLPGQAFDIFKNKGPRLYLPDNPRSLRKKIAPVSNGSVLSCNREGLAGRSSRNQIDAVKAVVEVLIVNVPLNQRPVPDMHMIASLICADCLAGIVVQLDHGIVDKARLRGSKSQTASTGEQFNTTETVRPFCKISGSPLIWNGDFFAVGGSFHLRFSLKTYK